VPKLDGEQVRSELLSSGALAKGLKIIRRVGELLIPITRKVDSKYPSTETEFESREESRSYQSIAEVPHDLKQLLPNSFDVIGHIALLKLPEELMPFRAEVGRALIHAHRNIRTVANVGRVESEYRLRDIEIIAGEQRTETVHKEHGLSFWLDVRKVYFSPRLAGERLRVAKQVHPKETIIDMFAGVGAFSVLIAKHRAPRKVFAIDINPDAIYYLEKNIYQNRVSDIVQPILGDATEVVRTLSTAERIIMNLPLGAARYFEHALALVRNGGHIHYYLIAREDNLSAHMESLNHEAARKNKKISYTVKALKSYSPVQKFFAIDLEVS
jgi:tRNA (guanine37-N1)-methyltransferase